MTKEKPQARVYEEILVLHPDVSDTDKKQLYVTSSTVIKEGGGKVHRLDTWGSRPLANPKAKRITRGWYSHMVFSADTQTISELRRRLRINDKVVYFHHEKLSEKQSVDKYMEEFLEGLAQTEKRESERIAKFQKKARA